VLPKDLKLPEDYVQMRVRTIKITEGNAYPIDALKE